MRRLTRLRDAYPILRRGRFFDGVYNETLGVKDVTWINATGEEMKPEDWQHGLMRCFGMLMDGRAQATGIRRAASDTTLLWILNAHHDVVVFTLPPCAGGRHWCFILDTNTPDADAGEVFGIGDTYAVTGRSTVLLELQK